jgi:Flp pilus assembly protein TadD
MLGACSQSGAQLDSLLGSPSSESTSVASATANGKPVSPQTELEKATEYWGKKYKESPKNLEAGLSFAKNLKALGEKRQALAVLQQVSVHHSKDRELASEYGRLALELDQVGIAKTMLAMADDPANPDWRVISARGTVLAKEGKYTEAIPVFERAMTLAPDQTSVMNNLAMA